jgi:hypothetical protein
MGRTLRGALAGMGIERVGVMEEPGAIGLDISVGDRADARLEAARREWPRYEAETARIMRASANRGGIVPITERVEDWLPPSEGGTWRGRREPSEREAPSPGSQSRLPAQEELWAQGRDEAPPASGPRGLAGPIARDASRGIARKPAGPSRPGLAESTGSALKMAATLLVPDVLALIPRMALSEIAKAETVAGKMETLATLFDRPVRLTDLDPKSSAISDLKGDPVARESLWADGLIDRDLYDATAGGGAGL